MAESFLNIENDTVYVRHSDISGGRPTILFVHGLGDSALVYKDAFLHPLMDNFNLIAPDLIGYGRSSAAHSGDYSFDNFVNILWKVVEHFGIEELVVVGHSLGGDITVLFCRSDKKRVIKKYINVEGNLTELDLFLSGRVVKAAEENDFDEWFENKFMDQIVFEGWAKDPGPNRLYYASLRFCRPEAFLANARELVERNTNLTGQKYISEIGKMYCDLNLPKVYCYGTESLPGEVINYLDENNLASKIFNGAGHMIMTQQPHEFYSFLHGFVTDTL